MQTSAAISMGSSLLWEAGGRQLLHSRLMIALTDGTDGGGKSRIK